MGTLRVSGTLLSGRCTMMMTALWRKRTSNAEQTPLNSPSGNRLSKMLSSELRLQRCNCLVCCCVCRRLNGDGGDSTAVHWREARVRHADGGVPPTDGERAHHSQLPTRAPHGRRLWRLPQHGGNDGTRVVKHRTRAVGVQPLSPSDDAPQRRRLLRALRDF